MKRSLLAVCAFLLAAPLAFARGGGGGRGFSGARASSGFRGGSRGFTGGFSRAAFHPSFSRSTSFARPAFRTAPAAYRPAGRMPFHAAANSSTRRATGSDSAPPPWTTIGAKIVSAGQPPVYSQAAGGGTHTFEGGGFISMDQSKAQDVGRSPGISWSRPDKTSSSGASGGGTGVSSNGPAFDPSF